MSDTGDIRCDRCDKPMDSCFIDASGGVGGNCSCCGDNLCASCAETWTEDGECAKCVLEATTLYARYKAGNFEICEMCPVSSEICDIKTVPGSDACLQSRKDVKHIYESGKEKTDMPSCKVYDSSVVDKIVRNPLGIECTEDGKPIPIFGSPITRQSYLDGHYNFAWSSDPVGITCAICGARLCASMVCEGCGHNYNRTVQGLLLGKLGTRYKSMEYGVKHDGEKLRWDLLPFDCLEELVKVLDYGAQKYAPNNWQTVENARARYQAALLRHFTQYKKGESFDTEPEEVKLRHIAQVAVNALFLLWFDMKDIS